MSKSLRAHWRCQKINTASNISSQGAADSNNAFKNCLTTNIEPLTVGYRAKCHWETLIVIAVE
jgi:hypothetical protein